MTPPLELASLAIAAVLFLGAAAVYLRGSKDKGTIDALSKNNAALTARVDLLEGDLDKCKAKLTSVERENTILRNVVTAADQIAHLQRALDVHHAEAMARLDTLHDDLTGSEDA